MNRNNSLGCKIATRISRKKSPVILREDFKDLGGYDQVGRILRQLVAKGSIVKIGYGLYARAKYSSLTGNLVPEIALPNLANEALQRLGVKTGQSTLEKEYNAGQTTQVPTGRRIGVRGRISRKIGYNGAYINYERLAK